MKIELWSIGKCAHQYIEDGIEVYKKNYALLSFEYKEWHESKTLRTAEKSQSLKLQSELILHKISNDDYLILFDEKGKMLDSKTFSKVMERWLSLSRKGDFAHRWSFWFSWKCLRPGKWKISLSQMTFSHDMVRLIILEQVYRAGTHLAKRILSSRLIQKAMTVTIALIALNALISWQAFSNHAMLDKLKHYPYMSLHRHEWVRMLTGTFVHGDIAHLLFNMYALYGFGTR